MNLNGSLRKKILNKKKKIIYNKLNKRFFIKKNKSKKKKFWMNRCKEKRMKKFCWVMLSIKN